MREYSDKRPVKQPQLSNWYPSGRVKVIVFLGAALLALGALLALINPALLVGPAEQMNNAARVFAGYMVSRNLSLAALLAGALALRARKVLGGLLALTALIQFVDAVIDCYEQRWAIVPVVVLLGLVFLIGAGSAMGSPVWKTEAWREN